MSLVEPSNLGDVHSSLFSGGNLPGVVFGSGVTNHAWVSFDALCCIDGWSLLSALAHQHGDASVHVVGLDLQEPRVSMLPVDASPERYRALCDDELVGLTWCAGGGRKEGGAFMERATSRLRSPGRSETSVGRDARTAMSCRSMLRCAWLEPRM